MAFNNTVVARVAAGIWGMKLGNATMNAALAQANTAAGGVDSVINSAFNDSFGNVSNAAVSAMVVANLGLTGAAATEGTTYLTNALNAVPTSQRGATISQALALFSGLTGPTFGPAAADFNTKVAGATAYAGTAGTQDAVLGFLPSGSSFFLTLGQDNITATAAADTFNAYIFDNSNSLQSADRLDGGAAVDTLYADMGSSQSFAVTPITTNIERFLVRAEAEASAQGDNNVGGNGRVDVDVQRMVGLTHIESNNSRSDVIIEDVRILASQITKDITVAFVESDPGHVDYALYFDQYSLKNQASTTSAVVLRSLDTYNTALLGTPSLKDSTYGGFTFTYIQNGVTKTAALGFDSTGLIKSGPGSIQAAVTLPELVTALQAEVNLVLGVGAATVTLGQQYTVPDPVTKTNVTGNEVVITTNAAGITIPATAAQPATTGWASAGVAPAVSNFYTLFSTDALTVSSLVTSTVILDDVGRGSTGGDLVIGGLSTGATSSSLGVQRFEIEVDDNSKLESINSTNNTLREVTIVNGLTTSSSHAYVATVKDAGNLTVNGFSGANGANVSGFSNRVQVTPVSPTVPGPADNALPGVQSTTQSAAAIQTFGFTDVRLIDATAMRGKFEFTAQVTSASLAKYLNSRDIQALPAGDNIAFIYSGGTVDDTMFVTLDTNAVASRNTIMSGREDFVFNTSGGTGNDWITLRVSPSIPLLGGGVQAWYTNQQLNRNITIDGGVGDDTIRKPGAGDVIINGGTGVDTIYADNTGTQGGTTGTDSNAGAAYTAAEAAELAAALALANLANSTNDGAALAPAIFGNPNPLGQPDTTVAALNTLNLVTPVTFTDPANAANPLVLSHAALKTAIDNAYAAGALTVQQQADLYVAYNVASAGTIVTPATLGAAPDITNEVPVAGNLTAAEFAAGNAVLDGYITAALAAAATADAADARVATEAALLNVTQLALVNAQLAVNGVASFEANQTIAGINLNGNGTATTLAGLTTLRTTLVLGATDAVVLAALVNARDKLIITAGQATALNNAATGGGAGTVDAAELFQIQVILEPLIAAATVANTTANTALTAAITANNAAISAAAGIVGADPVAAAAEVVANDFVGSTEAAAAAAAAAAALTAFNTATLTPALTVQSDLATLKAALSVGLSELNFTLLTAAAVAKGTITAGQATAINTAAGIPGAPAQAGTIDLTEKNAVDVLVTAIQFTNNAVVAQAQVEAATLAAIRADTAFASAQAAAAAAAAPNASTPVSVPDKAVFVLNTANQKDVTTTPGTGYVLAVNDERNVIDFKSSADDKYNMFGATVTVTFKDLVATATVPNTGFITSDLQVNQAIKDAINNNAVLSKVISAADGPGNTLILTSLIDGVMSNANLSVVLTLPILTALSTTDVAGAAVAYGLPATTTAADLLTAMTTVLTAFNTKGDYVDQLAETGAFGGNVEVTGAASITTSDNTITPGDGNDVTVLGTTVGVEKLLSSNDTVIFAPAFGNDTIVHFKAGALATGGDILNLSGLGGKTLGTAFNIDKSVNVANEVVATNGTTTLVAGLFTDSATAQTHVYVAVDPLTNIGKVYMVVDTVGVAAGSVTATLAGTIDLADTLWSTLTIENFA